MKKVFFTSIQRQSYTFFRPNLDPGTFDKSPQNKTVLFDYKTKYALCLGYNVCGSVTGLKCLAKTI